MVAIEQIILSRVFSHLRHCEEHSDVAIHLLL